MIVGPTMVSKALVGAIFLETFVMANLISPPLRLVFTSMMAWRNEPGPALFVLTTLRITPTLTMKLCVVLSDVALTAGGFVSKQRTRMLNCPTWLFAGVH